MRLVTIKRCATCSQMLPLSKFRKDNTSELGTTRNCLDCIMSSEEKKLCDNCNEMVCKSEFGLRKRSQDGLNNICKSCDRALRHKRKIERLKIECTECGNKFFSNNGGTVCFDCHNDDAFC